MRARFGGSIPAAMRNAGQYAQVEAQNILANHVEVCRPTFPTASVSVVRMAENGDIVGQRIQPDS